LTQCSNVILENPGNTDMAFIITHDSSGQTLKIQSGSTFALMLRNPASGGYTIQTPLDFDPDVLYLLKKENIAPKDGNIEGDFGKIKWIFRAETIGTTYIVVNAFRPWEKDKTIEFFKVKIDVVSPC
jgi:predicted secreted protein